jgi:predicted nucleic acid-binding protein
MTRIYLDSCVIIYLVENAPRAQQVVAFLQNYPDHIQFSSNLALMECLVAPLRTGNTLLVRAYETYFDTMQMIPSRQSVFRQAAELRAHLQNLSVPDALHTAYALVGRCDLLLTGDKRLANAWSQYRLFTSHTLQVVSV